MTNLFKELIWDALVKAILSRLFWEVPLLGWGPIGFVITWIAGKYSDELYTAVSTIVDVERIAFRDERLQEAFNESSVKLRVIAIDSGLESVEFKEARDEHKKMLSQLVHFNAI